MSGPPALTSVRREWLEQVLGVVRRLGASTDLDEVLDLIARAIVEVLDFGAVAINVTGADGHVRVEAVAGPPGVAELLGTSSPLAYWLQLLDSCEPWGALRFLSHEVDQSAIGIATWRPDLPDTEQTSAGGWGSDSWHPDDSLFAPLLDADGSLIGAISVDQPRSGARPDLEQRTVLELFASQATKAIIETSARKHAEERTRAAELRWQWTFERSPVAAALVNLDGTLGQVNDAFATMLGHPRDYLEGRPFAELTHEDDLANDQQLFAELLAGRRDSYAMEKRYWHRDGHVVWAVLHVGVIAGEDGAAPSVVAQMNDITDRKLAERQLAHRATHDPLTDLPNRALLEQRLATYLADGRRAGVLFCDIDRFKTINDSLGHDAGDELLVAVAHRLAAAMPPGDILGRVGGDEFVAVVADDSNLGALQVLAKRLMVALDEPLIIRGHEHTVTMSVGLAAAGQRNDHPDDLLREADQALMRAKHRGRARVESYDPLQDRPATVDDLELELALRTALVSETGLVAYFQPILELSSDMRLGYEVLARWQHPTKGMLQPIQFLPLAEETGLIVPLGWRMLDVGAATAAAVPTTWVAVNVSGSQLGLGQLSSAVRRTLQRHQLHPARLHLEITETALVEASPAAIREVQAVADMGVTIALDDFGTGYSSLSLLRDLPVSTVKIDRSFIAPLAHDRSALAITRSVIGLCQDLGITTVAEGVEDTEQLAALRALGCTQAQGYLIGRPVPLDVVLAQAQVL